MKKMLAISLSIVLLLGILSGCASPSNAPASDSSSNSDPAANYPSTNITFIVPYTAGGGTDALARLLAAGLETGQAQPDRGGCRRRGDQAHRSDQG